MSGSNGVCGDARPNVNIPPFASFEFLNDFASVSHCGGAGRSSDQDDLAGSHPAEPWESNHGSLRTSFLLCMFMFDPVKFWSRTKQQPQKNTHTDCRALVDSCTLQPAEPTDRSIISLGPYAGKFRQDNLAF
ncbi:hypothetical protein TWF225_006292 [Orbilia oligospora]|uniref:Uncharacterized protein n=1 Tax=Orbilia oligospora TaxID=2813651 RepID=A0A7C8PPB7_ORBOL|nr:hypothetical protein TWF751_008653 [Orbilia oligospora]KAF3183142.1 hypothetical protein TWF225_006292 [Orbilia oligospora]KAF3238828.1 hypothetical protein TWF128_011910 [Orbilia oligospora]KAF3251143.1 hypothetical protein TWF217_008072 [Orbilia oligospora]KAF3274222.1 hypothetical protein TWF132_003756 [Orbilia oligospora]